MDTFVVKGDDVNHASWLTIVWYQDDFALPIDWDDVAERYEF